MRWIIGSLFGCDQVREAKNFARFCKLAEARILTADGRSVGWIQESRLTIPALILVLST
jgi:hypothetical protein